MHKNRRDGHFKMRGENMKVAILAIGNEVLCGKTINTNSAFIAKEVEQLGGKIVHQ